MKRRTLTADRDGTLAELLGPEGRHVIERGGAYVDGRRCRDPQRVVRQGAVLVAVLEESGRAPPREERPLHVLFEDDGLVAVDKPPGLLTQPGPSGGISLLDLVSKHLGKPAGLVHRLDRETSGVVVFGKSRAATAELAGEFREGRAKKRYVAIVSSALPAHGVIELPLSRDPSRPGRWRATRQANGVPALTRYEASQVGALTVVALFPETGRTHQLRAHLAALGAPILGDRLYGGADAPRCLLHAQSLTISGRTLESPLPADMHLPGAA